MNNYLIAFGTYLTLVFVTAKLWGRIDNWSWFWVVSPMFVIVFFGIIGSIYNQARHNRMRKNIATNLQNLRTTIDKVNTKQSEQEEREKTLN